MEATRALGAEIGAMLDRGAHWWDEHWTSFEPDTAWRAPAFPDGWEAAPVPPAPGPSAYRMAQTERHVPQGSIALPSGPRSFTFQSGGWCRGVALGRYGKPLRCPA